MQEEWLEDLLLTPHIPQHDAILHNKRKSRNDQDQTHSFERFRFLKDLAGVKYWSNNCKSGEDPEGDQLASAMEV